MSRWTHIRGGLELESSPFEYKKCKLSRPLGLRTKENDDDFRKYLNEKFNKAYYPFEEEQIKIGTPVYQDTFDNKPYLSVSMYEYSLPRARKYIDEAFGLLPQGEIGWHPSIYQDESHTTSSSSSASYKCTNNAYKKAILKAYNYSYYKSFSFKELEKCLHLKLNWVNHVSNIVVGIREDIRYCSGQEMLEGLEKFFKHLEENDIRIEDGYLEWQDEYEEDKIYAWRCSRLEFDIEMKFMILDKKTNKILWQKLYKHKHLPNSDEIDWDAYINHEYDIVEETFCDEKETRNS